MRTDRAISTLAEVIYRDYSDRSIEADRDAQAAAGSDYGYVREWVLADSGLRLIAYGDSGEINTVICDDADDDLLTWLIHDDLDGIDALVEQASVRGIDAVEAATEEDIEAAIYYILAEHSYNGPHTSIRVVYPDGTEGWAKGERGDHFACYADAAAWIAEADEGIYQLPHNESGRPTYKIVAE
jgi:hypothetical protein